MQKSCISFFDGRGATAAYEKELLRVTARITPILDAYAKKNKLNVSVTAKEIVVAHMAEGGALLLTSAFAEVDNIHPVMGIGLDDYRIGLQRFPGLIPEIDASFGTRVGALKGGNDDKMTFTESIIARPL